MNRGLKFHQRHPNTPSPSPKPPPLLAFFSEGQTPRTTQWNPLNPGYFLCKCRDLPLSIYGCSQLTFPPLGYLISSPEMSLLTTGPPQSTLPDLKKKKKKRKKGMEEGPESLRPSFFLPGNQLDSPYNKYDNNTNRDPPDFKTSSPIPFRGIWKKFDHIMLD